MKTRLAILLSVMCVAFGWVEAAESGVVISVEAAKTKFRVGEALKLYLTVTNTGTESVYVPEIDVRTSAVEIDLWKANGKLRVGRPGDRQPVIVELNPGRCLKHEFDLLMLEPEPFNLVRFQVRARYHIISDRTVVSEPLEIEIAEMSETEAVQAKEYAVALSGADGGYVKAGMGFLKKWPGSVYENRLLLAVAQGFASRGSLAEGLALYDRVTESSSAQVWEKERANSMAATFLHKAGDVRAAIDRLRRNRNSASRLAADFLMFQLYCKSVEEIPKVEGTKMAAMVSGCRTVAVTELASGNGGVTAAMGEYLVVDLSAGPSSSNYPVGYLSAVPAGGWTDEYKTTKLVLRSIPAGTFVMGSPTNELGRSNDETQHSVTLTKAFYIGVFEVTQRQWELVMSNRPSYFSNSTDYASRPVEQVSSYDIREDPANRAIEPGWPITDAVHADSFMGKLRAKTGLTGFDLPTESQWEYACRAGTTTALNSGHDLTSDGSNQQMNVVGRYKYNCGEDLGRIQVTSVVTAKVGSYLPNAWGLYDMHGNVWEWCLDWYGEYPMHSNVWAWCFDWHRDYPATVTDPRGDSLESARVNRGGSWGNDASYGRSACRSHGTPGDRLIHRGFRVCCIPQVNSELKQGKETIGVARP